MRKVLIVLWLSAAFQAVPAQSQSFINLNFESATDLPPTFGFGAVTNLLPGWSAVAGTIPLTSIVYNGFDVSPSVELLGFTGYEPGGNFAVGLLHGSISQTGLVPADSVSLLFDASETSSTTPFFVSLDGQDLSYSTISAEVNSSGVSYNVYGAEIPAFAGKEETLTFSPDVRGGVLDDIQFSPMTIPEPSEIAMLACGIVGFGFYRWRRFELRRHER